MNSHNLWMMVGSWQSSDQPLVGPLTPTMIGVSLFVGVSAALLIRSWAWLSSEDLKRSEYLSRLFVLAAAIYTSFFFLSTNLHENHLLMAIPLLLLVAGRSRFFLWLTLACSVAAFLNMALHDIDIPYLLPYPLAERSPFDDPYLVFDQLRNPILHAYGSDVRFTWLQWGGIAMNTLLVAVVWAATCVAAWRGSQARRWTSE